MATAKKKSAASNEAKKAIEASRKNGRRFPASAYERKKSTKRYPDPE